MKPSVLIAVSVSASASAFVLPPSDSSTPNNARGVASYEAKVDSAYRFLSLACPDCPRVLSDLPAGEADESLTQSAVFVPSLELSLTVIGDIPSDHSGPDSLYLNGFEIYPHSDWPAPLRAWDDREQSSIHRLGYDLSIQPVESFSETDDDESYELLQVTLRIVDVDAVSVDMPAVVALVVKDSKGHLKIADLDVPTDEEDLPSTPELSDPTDCDTLMCQLRQILNIVQSTFRPHCSHSSMPAEYEDGVVPEDELEPESSPENQPEDASEDNVQDDVDDDYYYAQWTREDVDATEYDDEDVYAYSQTQNILYLVSLFRDLVSQIIIPVLIGIGTGIGLSLVGVLIASIGLYLWRLVTRRQSAEANLTPNCVYAISLPVDEKAILKTRYEVNVPPPQIYHDEPKEST